jgi:hypothetical protein
MSDDVPLILALGVAFMGGFVVSLLVAGVVPI